MDRPALRVDAERNRDRIIAAAREVFAEHGLDAPLEQVARRAGVGVATLYRRFPTRADLVAGAFETKMAAYADAVDRALDEPDAGKAFREYVETVCAMQAADRGFTDVLTMTFPTAKQFEAARGRAYDGFVELIVRSRRGLCIRLVLERNVVKVVAESDPQRPRGLYGGAIDIDRA